MSLLIKRVASIYLENKGFFPPELIGAESDGSLLYESDEESYMKPNFSAQIFRELSDRQVAGELSDGQPITEQREPQGGRKGDRIAQRVAQQHLKKSGSQLIKNIVKDLEGELGNLNYNGGLRLRWEGQDADELFFSCDVLLFDEDHPYVQNAGREEYRNNYFVSIQNLDRWLERQIDYAGYEYGSKKFKFRIKADDEGHIANKLTFSVFVR